MRRVSKGLGHLVTSSGVSFVRWSHADRAIRPAQGPMPQLWWSRMLWPPRDPGAGRPLAHSSSHNTPHQNPTRLRLAPPHLTTLHQMTNNHPKAGHAIWDEAKAVVTRPKGGYHIVILPPPTALFLTKRSAEHATAAELHPPIDVLTVVEPMPQAAAIDVPSGTQLSLCG